MRTAALVALAILLIAPAALAGPTGDEIDEAVQRATGGGFWGAILVAKGDEVLLAKGYGFADYRSRPNAPETLFEIASASKQFTAAAILRLEQKGKLSTSDPVTKFFRGLPDDKKVVTLHHLLTHTSGLARNLGVPYDSPIGRKEYVGKMLTPPLATKPGEKFAYSNVGYALLAAIVEVASGGSFEDYMKKEIFEPAGLEDTGFIRDPKLLRSGRASLRLTDGPRDRSAVNWHWGWGYRGMGGVVTTILDLHRWDRALRGTKVLGEPAKVKLYTPSLENYACGWRSETTDRGTTKVSHGGGVAGYGCMLVRYLQDDVSIAILSNGKTNPHTVAKTITDLLFTPPRVEVVLDATPYEQNEYRGAEFTGDVRWEVSKNGGILSLVLKDGKHEAIRITVPPTYAPKIVGGLRAAIARRRADDDGAPAAVQGGIYLNRYPAGKRIELTEKLEIVIMPEYRGRGEDGKPVIDRRTILVIQDAKYRMWCSIVKMNVAAARELLEGIEKLLK